MKQRNRLYTGLKSLIVMVFVFVFAANLSLNNVKAQDNQQIDPTLDATSDITPAALTEVPEEVPTESPDSNPTNLVTETTLSEQELIALAKDEFLNGANGVDSDLVFVSDIKVDLPWATGMLGVKASETQEEPYLITFLANYANDTWTIAFESTELFDTWLEQVPESILSTDQKSVYRSMLNAQGNGFNQFSLPWATGETWKLNGGPHRNDTSVAGQAWSSLDFQGIYSVNQVRAVNSGIAGVSSTCPNFVVITHPDGYKTGYYHLANVQVSNGQSIPRGTYLGDTSTQAGCGGYATGPHVHFSLRNSSNVGIAISGIDLGGWTVQSNGIEYGGCLARISDGFQACKGTGTGIYNDGSIGSGSAPGPVCPATTTTQAYVCTPALTPTYVNNSCSTYWYPFAGFNGFSAYLTENAQSVSTSSNSGRWTPNLQTPGTYKVEAYVAYHAPFNVTCPWGTASLNSDTSNAKYVVHSGNGDNTVTKDQLPLANQWLDLGQYTFNAGSGSYVTLTDFTGEAQASRNVSLSAMRFTLISNPIPSISSISPSTAAAGSEDINLTVYGALFTENSVVRWNGSDRPTTFVSSSQIIAAVPAPDLVSAGAAIVTVFTPTPGGGTSNALTFTVESPGVSITSINPTEATVGGGGFTLSVNGTNFMNGAIVKWDGSNRTTSFVSSSLLTATINANDISAAGNHEISVTNPSPSNKTSNIVSFVVKNPLPILNSLEPNHILEGSSDLTLVINGSNFISGAIVTWDDIDLSTSFVSASRLTAQVPAAYFATADEVSISVYNPAPSNGISVTQNFRIHTFADAVPTSWYWRYVEGFFAKGITTGCNTGPLRYCPDRAVTRAEMAVFILRSQHAYALPYTPDPDPSVIGAFSDVPVTGKEWMQPWIEEFYQTGMTTGCNNAPLSYCPERQVTRAEMAVFVLRAVHGKDYVPPAATGVFSDVPVSGKQWMQPWIEQFYREGITTGCAQSPLLYCPEQSVTRAEMATFLDRAFGFPQLP